MKEVVEFNSTTENVPAGHYSHAVIHDGLIYLSGQLGINGSNPNETGLDFNSQIERCMKRIQSILEEAGSALNRVIKATIYISDIAYWGTANEIYAAFMHSHKPARVIVPVSTLHFGSMVEIEVVAAIG